MASQTTMKVRSIGVSCVPEYVDAQTNCDLIEKQSDTESFYDPDSSFCMSQEESGSEEECAQSNVFSSSFVDFHPLENEINDTSGFIVYWACLLVLLRRCLTCALPAMIIKKTVNGSALLVEVLCAKGHRNIWRSQTLLRGFYHGNVKLAASVLFSSNTFTKICKYFEMADIAWISKSRFYALQKKYLFGVAYEAWQNEQETLISQLQDKESCCFSGDGRCDSPGHNAKYLTYSFGDQSSGKIIVMSLTQVTEAGNSNRMEKYGFIKAIDETKEKKLKIKQLTTDRHMQIKKYLREEEEDIDHQFDVWHFCKNIRKKLLAAAKKKSCNDLNKWIKSICNHFWWASATCENDEQLLKEKWTSIIFHVQNIHEWSSNEIFKCCAHIPYSNEQQRNKEWLKPTSESFKVLQDIIFNKATLTDLKHVTKFSHTGALEVYHSLYNKWMPKSHHFSFSGMLARSQLAAIDFNLSCDLPQAKTMDGEDRYNVSFSKFTNKWTSKPIKEKKSRNKFHGMVSRTLEIISQRETLPTPNIPDLPQNIAPIVKPSKDEVVKSQNSRFEM